MGCAASSTAQSVTPAQPRPDQSDKTQPSTSRQPSEKNAGLRDGKQQSSHNAGGCATGPADTNSAEVPNTKQATVDVGFVFKKALETTSNVAVDTTTLPSVVESILKILDRDSSGTIDLDDLRKFIQSICEQANLEPPPSDQIMVVFKQLDIDRNGHVSRTELAAVLFRWFIVGVT